MSSIYDWSTTPDDNATVDSAIVWSEGMNSKLVNNSSRAEMGRVREFVTDLGGAVTSGGSVNAQTVTVSSAFTTYATGRIVAFKAGYTNTGATTLSVNGIGAKAVRKDGDVALVGGEIKENGVYLVRYNAAANSAAGAWMLQNPSIAATNISGLGTAATQNTGTSGSNVPLLNAENTVGAAWTFQSGYSGGSIASLVGGSNFGGLLYGMANGHLVIGIQDNDSTDSFSIVSGGGDYATNSTFDKLVAQFKADGSASIGGNLSVSGTISTTGAATFGSSVQSSQVFQTGTSSAVLQPGSNGTIYLRPVTGSSSKQSSLNSSGNWSIGGNINVSGTITSSGDITYSSDRNLKFNIRPIGRALSRLLKVHGATFKKKGQKRRSIGVIAQDVQAAFPEAVRKDESGYLSVVAGGLDGAIIEALREIVVRLEALEAAK